MDVISSFHPVTDSICKSFHISQTLTPKSGRKPKYELTDKQKGEHLLLWSVSCRGFSCIGGGLHSLSPKQLLFLLFLIYSLQ